MMKVLVTGAAGFIGFHAARALASRGDGVVGLDNVNDYYDVRLKYGRLACTGIECAKANGGMVRSDMYPSYGFVRMDITDREGLEALFTAERFDVVCHLAAQAGVRYSLENPYAYAQSNLAGFVNILECCRRNGVKHLVYASSSSVYGNNNKVPFSEDDRTDSPVSLYAATKKSNELMACTYSHLYGLRTTGLRLFTVYGPWGRPDMAPMLFAKAILAGEEINVYNNGDMMRDFTCIDDIAEGLLKVVDGGAGAGRPVYNMGCSNPVRLTDFIGILEEKLGVKARRRLMPMQPGDVRTTYADTGYLERDFGYRPRTTIEEGVGRFVEWYMTENPVR